jgi:DNA-binding NarL/FixJ family response regulator
LRIVIVDDHPIVREGLVSALDGRESLEVAGSFERAEDALREEGRLRPDVVVLDLELPGLGGLEAIPRFHAPVLILTAYAEEEDVSRAFKAGARGYLLKGSPIDDIVRAIGAVGAGESWIDPRVASPLLHRDPRQQLTPREREVLKLIVAGRANKVIAESLGISERTVKFHVTAILGKLGAENRAHAVALATERHLV